MKCPFYSEFGKWVTCPHLRADVSVDVKLIEAYCASQHHIGKSGSWCGKMIGKAMLAHKIWIGNDY